MNRRYLLISIPNSTSMDRREILQWTAALTGAAIVTPLASCFLSSCQQTTPSSSTTASHLILGEEDLAWISGISDIILPATNSPSASSVGVPEMIQKMVSEVFTKVQQEKFQSNIHTLRTFTDEQGSAEEAVQKIESGLGSDQVQAAYLSLKQQAIAYYLTTEEVGKNFLAYLPVPGKYEPCITIDANTKAWAI